MHTQWQIQDLWISGVVHSALLSYKLYSSGKNGGGASFCECLGGWGGGWGGRGLQPQNPPQIRPCNTDSTTVCRTRVELPVLRTQDCRDIVLDVIEATYFCRSVLKILYSCCKNGQVRDACCKFHFIGCLFHRERDFSLKTKIHKQL